MQRTTEWLEQTERVVGYFRRQFASPFRSTVAFANWLEANGCLSPSAGGRVADVGAGMGQVLAYLARRFPSTAFTGIELNPRYVEEGNQLLREHGAANVQLVPGDLFALGAEHRGQYDGLLSMQTLSWMPNCETPLEQMIALQPRWIAVTSLFFDGLVDAKIEVREYDSATEAAPSREEFYNTYSIPRVRELFRAHGFTTFRSTPFQIDTDLPPPALPGMGTYTAKLDTGARLQLSGPLLMNWHFILAKRA